MNDHDYFSKPAKDIPAQQYAAKMSAGSELSWEIEGLKLIQQGLARLSHNTRARLLDPPSNRIDWLGDLVAEKELYLRDIKAKEQAEHNLKLNDPEYQKELKRSMAFLKGEVE
jgi:hypothetical protein